MKYVNFAFKRTLILLSLFCQPAFNVTADDLNILSYNVYFDDKTGIKRYPQIIDFIKNKNYNIIALQECTSAFINLLLSDSYFNKFTIAFGDAKHGYQNIILTSLATKSQGEIALTTSMGRSAPYITLADSQFQIVNVHLESGLSDVEARKQQLNEIFKANQGSKNTIITGDFNFDDGADEEFLLKSFQDLGKKENKVTYDTQNNVLAQKTKFTFESSRRLDRIFLKCDDCISTKFDVLSVDYSDHWPISAIITNDIDSN